MKMEVGHRYILVFKVGDRILTYEGKIKNLEGDFIEFVDKFGKLRNYNKSLMLSTEMIE